MAAKETIGDGGGRKYANSQIKSTVQAAKKSQQQLWLPTTPSGGTCMTACTLQKSQKASSSLSRLTKKVT